MINIEINNPKYVLHGHQHKNKRTNCLNTEVIGIHGGVIFDTSTGEIVHVLSEDD